MEKFDNTLNQLRDSYGELKDNMHMLDEIVPVEEQMKYFQYSKYIETNKEQNSLDRNYLIARLFTPEVEIEDKRYYLSSLAKIADVASYRAIEAYHKIPLEPELKHWSALALAESKLLLNAELSGEKQFFVSTGLGGKDKKLRYFAVIASANREKLSDFQVQTLLRELQFCFDQDKIDLEKLELRENYLKLFLLCDLNHEPRISVEKAINESNLFGEYVDPSFLLTNVKQMEDKEIESFLNKTKTAEE